MSEPRECKNFQKCGNMLPAGSHLTREFCHECQRMNRNEVAKKYKAGMTAEQRKKYRRNEMHKRIEQRRREQIYNANGAHKAVKIIDPICADPYYISKTELELNKHIYARMREDIGLKVLVNGQEVRL